MRNREKMASAVVTLGLLIFFFAAPVVPYTQAVGIPGNYKYIQGPCPGSGIVLTGPVVCSFMNGTLPAVSLEGFSSLSYLLLGYGTAPFANGIVVRQGNMSALVFFRNGRAVAAEGPLGGGPSDVRFKTSGSVEVTSASLTPGGFGEAEFAATIENMGETRIPSPSVSLEVTGLESYVGNQTIDGITWFTPDSIGMCGSATQPYLDPGESCAVSAYLDIASSGSVYSVVQVNWEQNDTGFIYRQAMKLQVPTPGVGPSWVSGFIQDVNGNRSSPLVENLSLDQFAALRFKSASAVPDISDYNFSADVASWFGPGNGTFISEALLYPGGYTPGSYAQYLQTLAPGHWSALTDPAFGEFGYYIGTAPYYEIQANCPVTEIPGGGVNITQYFESHGCKVTTIPAAIWLVIVLGP